MVLGEEKSATSRYCSNTNYFYPCLDTVAVKDVHNITRSICNINQAKQYLQRHPICLTDSDYDYILEEIDHRDKIEYEKNIRGYDEKE